jgi:glutathione S-transferase
MHCAGLITHLQSKWDAFNPDQEPTAMTPAPVTFYHAPKTRSSMVLWLLEEIGQPYELKLLNMNAGEHRSPAQLAINPMGKVPVIQHMGETVTESTAIATYLAELYPEAQLAPKVGDRRRGPYLRWMFFYPACFEPAIVDKALKRDEGMQSMSPYGSYDTTIAAIADTLGKGPYMLGDTFSALDVVYGAGLGWTMMFKLVPERPEFTRYIAELHKRPAWIAAQKKDAEFAALFA